MRISLSIRAIAYTEYLWSAWKPLNTWKIHSGTDKMPQRYGVYRIRNFRLGKVNYARPWIFLRERPDGTSDCFPITTKNYDPDHLMVTPGHPDHAAAGFDTTVFILYARAYEVQTSLLTAQIGVIQNELLRALREKSGLPD